MGGAEFPYVTSGYVTLFCGGERKMRENFSYSEAETLPTR